MAKDKREFTDFHPQFPDENKVKCNDCKFRDKTEVDLLGKHYRPGITRDTCEAYKNGNHKPLPILFEQADCQYYEKDSE